MMEASFSRYISVPCFSSSRLQSQESICQQFLPLFLVPLLLRPPIGLLGPPVKDFCENKSNKPRQNENRDSNQRGLKPALLHPQKNIKVMTICHIRNTNKNAYSKNGKRAAKTEHGTAAVISPTVTRWIIPLTFPLLVGPALR